MAAAGNDGFILTLRGITQRAPLTVSFVAALNGALLIGNGVFMLFWPMAWYYAIPGVTDTGFFNQHFIRDIGMIQLFVGGAFWYGIARPALRVVLWASASVWLTAHALFHVWEVFVGICAPSALLRDFAGVSMPALLGIAITWWAWSKERA